MKRLSPLIAAWLVAAPAHADWLYFEEENAHAPGLICSLAYEEENHGFLIWADDKAVAVILTDTSWSLASDFKGWAGAQYDGQNYGFEMQQMNEITMFSFPEEEKWTTIVAKLAENTAGTLVTPMAKVWTLPTGASDVTMQWIACIAKNGS